MIDLLQKFRIQPREGFSERWATGRLTLLDIAIVNNAGLANLVDETVGAFPEVALVGMLPIEGTVYKQLVRVERPEVGFRDANEGTDPSRSRYEERQFDCHIFNPRWEVDKAVADRHIGGAQLLISEEAAAVLESTFEHLGKQFYYGTANDGKGFPGLMSIYDTTNMEVDAGGSSNKGSVWGLRLNRNQVQFLLGASGALELSPVSIRDIADVSGKRFEAYVQTLQAHIGLRVTDLRSVGRIKNIGSDSGKKMTDALTHELINKFPANQPPDVLLMNRVKREQLRQSRITDLVPNPPTPTESCGIPIVCTDALTDSE